MGVGRTHNKKNVSSRGYASIPGAGPAKDSVPLQVQGWASPNEEPLCYSCAGTPGERQEGTQRTVYGTHFDGGAATMASQRGADETTIKMLGRWRVPPTTCTFIRQGINWRQCRQSWDRTGQRASSS